MAIRFPAWTTCRDAIYRVRNLFQSPARTFGRDKEAVSPNGRISGQGSAVIDVVFSSYPTRGSSWVEVEVSNTCSTVKAIKEITISTRYPGPRARCPGRRARKKAVKYNALQDRQCIKRKGNYKLQITNYKQITRKQ